MGVLSVAAALGIKLTRQKFNVGYPLSSSFLAAIAISFWYGGTGPGLVSVVLSFVAFGYFVLPYEVAYRMVLPHEPLFTPCDPTLWSPIIFVTRSKESARAHPLAPSCTTLSHSQ